MQRGLHLQGNERCLKDEANATTQAVTVAVVWRVPVDVGDKVMLPLDADVRVVIPAPVECGAGGECHGVISVPFKVALPEQLHVVSGIPTDVERPTLIIHDRLESRSS